MLQVYSARFLALDLIYRIRQILVENNWQKPSFGDSQNYVEGKERNRDARVIESYVEEILR
jgi:hypothetical protein